MSKLDSDDFSIDTIKKWKMLRDRLADEKYEIWVEDENILKVKSASGHIGTCEFTKDAKIKSGFIDHDIDIVIDFFWWERGRDGTLYCLSDIFEPLNKAVSKYEACFNSVDKNNVNHPTHYNTASVECIDLMHELYGVDAVKSFCKCNALKYLYRADSKNGLEDIKKAAWYLAKYVEVSEDE